MLRRDPFLNELRTPGGQSLGRGSPVAAVALHALSQTDHLVLCPCGPTPQPHQSLRTLWNPNCTCVSHFLRKMIRCFREQTVKGAWEPSEGWAALGLLRPYSRQCPCVHPCELSSARAGMGIKRVEAPGGSQPRGAQSPEAPGRSRGWPKAPPRQPGPHADLANSAAALSPKWDHRFCVRGLFQACQ